MSVDDGLDIDGVPLDQLLPPPNPKTKRKEPNTLMEAEATLKNAMATALPSTNKGPLSSFLFGLLRNSALFAHVLTKYILSQAFK